MEHNKKSTLDTYLQQEQPMSLGTCNGSTMHTHHYYMIDELTVDNNKQTGIVSLGSYWR